MYIPPEQFAPAAGRIADRRPRISSLLEKGSGRINEDLVLAGERTFGVFDGATSLVPAVFAGGHTGGYLAAQACRDAFAAEETDLLLSARRANETIRIQSLAAGVDYRRKEELWSASAAVVRLGQNHFSWCGIGDCRIVVVYGDGRHLVLTKGPNHDAATLLSWRQKAGRCSAGIMEVMAEEILQVRRRMNRDYGVFNGEAEALSFLGHGSSPLAGVRDIIIFSDGLDLPRNNPRADPDMGTFLDLYEGGGLSGVRRAVRTKQLEDLFCTRYPRFKIHDDIGAVALRFSD